MKKPELEKVVAHHFTTIEKYIGQIPGAFSVEDLHRLRVEYKKLRAFLRLLLGSKAAAKLLSKLKKMYNAAGKIRDLQLFLPLLPQNAQKPQTLQQFTQCLHRSLFSNKEKLVKEIEKVRISKISAAVNKELPAVMEDSSIQKFIQYKIASIKVILLAIQTEKDLHLIRKHLKDIILNIKLFRQHWGISFPVSAWKSEKSLNDVAESLGRFNDLCTSASFFKSACAQNVRVEEKKLVEAWENKWIQQIKQHKKQLIPLVQQMQLTHRLKQA